MGRRWRRSKNRVVYALGWARLSRCNWIFFFTVWSFSAELSEGLLLCLCRLLTRCVFADSGCILRYYLLFTTKEKLQAWHGLLEGCVWSSVWAGCGLFVLLILSSDGQRKGRVGQEQIIAWSVREGYLCVNGRAILAKILGLFTQSRNLMKCEMW